MTPRDFLSLPPIGGGVRLEYGPGPLHTGDLRLPDRSGGGPLLLVLHGGFWRTLRDRIHMERVCAALAGVGVGTFNIEYRRIGEEGGGWPGTFSDVRLAADFIRGRAESVAVMGYSAGGHLALLLAAACPWLRGAIGLAPVADLERARALDLGEGAVDEFLGCAAGGGLLREASPIENPPCVPVRMVHGTADEVVPIELSRGYARRTGASLEELEGANHFDMVNPASAAWPAVVRAVAAL